MSKEKIDDGKFFTPKAARDAIAGERPLDEMLKAPLPTGNAAALREAVDYLCERLAELDATFDPSEVDCLRAALSAPPKNCDRFATVDKAMDYFADDALIEEWNALKAGKDRDMLAKELFMFAKWLFAPATERKGESDGK